jgi:uncharacterized protein (DUF433 family)
MTPEQRTALQAVVKIDPAIMHGTPCFCGTRVPVQTLIDFLETGETVDHFLSVYPYISLEQAVAFLELSKELTLQQLAYESS